MRYLLIIPLLLFACQESPTATSEPVLGKPFTLKVGESVAFDNSDLVITFVGVLDDSRCAQNVLCVWQGNAEMQFSLIGDMTFLLNSFLDNRETLVSDYLVTFVNLQPQTHTQKSIDPQSYIVELVITEQ